MDNLQILKSEFTAESLNNIEETLACTQISDDMLNKIAHLFTIINEMNES